MPRPRNNNLLQFYEFNANNALICNNGNCRGKELNRHSANLQRHLRSRHNNLYAKYVKQIHSSSTTTKQEPIKTTRGKRKRLTPKTEEKADPLDSVAVELATLIKTENSTAPPPAASTTTTAATTTNSEPVEEQHDPQQQQQFDVNEKLSSSSFTGLSMMFNSFAEPNSTAASSTDAFRLLEHSRRQEEEDETSALNFFKSCLPDYKRLTKSKQRKLKEFFIKKLNEMLDEAEQGDSTFSTPLA